MERLTTKFKDGYLFNLPPINDEKAQEEYLEKLSMKIGRCEDAEEQGLLLRLPCKVGDTVYVIGSLSEFGVNEEIELKVFECMVNKITLNGKYGNTMQMDCKEHSSFGWSMNMRKIDELVFLTKAEAEQKN